MRNFNKIVGSVAPRPHTKYGMVVTEGGNKTPLVVIRNLGADELSVQSNIQTKLGRTVETFHEDHLVYCLSSRDQQVFKGHTSLQPL
jgi:hypothetical protein